MHSTMVAFAAGPGIAGVHTTASYASTTKACVLPSRSRFATATPSRTVLLYRAPALPSRHAKSRALCGCAGPCMHTTATPAAAAAASTRTTPSMTVALSPGEQAIADLMTNNAAFVRGEPKIYEGVPEERARLASEGQAPKVAIIACADSRVAPELVFQTTVGQLFVMRAAGNTAWGPEVLGSLEFAVNVLGVSAVMVLGHTECGAVAAAVGGGELPGALGVHITNITKGIEGAGGVTPDVGLAVERNVQAALDFLRKDPNGCIAQGEKKGLAVRGAVYDIATGEVKLL